jgi:hypothetical protein
MDPALRIAQGLQVSRFAWGCKIPLNSKHD